MPVSGPTGMGEYQRSIMLAEALLERRPDWDVRVVVSADAPYSDRVPLPSLITSRSPTEVPREVDDILKSFAPHVAVFDSSGRRSSLRTASRLGARTVFISNHTRKRRRGFRMSRLRHTDEHWIMRQSFVSSELTALERWKLRWLDKPEPLFVDTIFPDPVLPEDAPREDFFVACPGGGGNLVAGRQSGALYAEAALRVAEATATTGVVVAGANFTGRLPEHPRLVCHHSLPGRDLLGLLSAARFALVGGGDLLPQTIALHVPAVAAATASDQRRRIAGFVREGLCLAAHVERMAETTIAARLDGRLEALAERLRGCGVRNRRECVVERLEALARDAVVQRR